MVVPVPPSLIIGVDVGTGSARAGVFDRRGAMLGTARADLTLWRGPGTMVEQSSAQIWDAVARSVRGAMAQAGAGPGDIAGIGFDATCSLAVLGPDGQGLPVGPSDDPARDVVVWMDHRAVAEAEEITATGHPVLRYVGGVISPEMETPKLLWLARHRPDVFAGAAHFLDLADFLTWKATGDLARSTNTVTCKWTYLAHERRWDDSYFHRIGLGVLADEGFARIGARVVDPGTPLGSGLTDEAARTLGLRPGTPVGAGMIDAHAGGIGTVGVGGNPLTHLGYVFGTSSCTMTSTAAPVFVPGVWGPYFSAMVPGLWVNEGGQSAAGAAIEQLVLSHPASAQAQAQAREAGQSLPDFLAARLTAGGEAPSELVQRLGALHVVPEYLGNRAPHADPEARAVIAGLGMERDLDSLAMLYLAGLCGIGYGLRQILQAQAEAGAPVEKIVISGGAGESPLVRQVLADTTGRPVLATTAEEPVLLGAAILGAMAGGLFADMPAAMAALSHAGTAITPSGGATAALHARRYTAFTRLQALARELRGVGGVRSTLT
ncbi:MAG: FGGY-family carbohydrate kinase [Rubellimicrobium sp.]|nr:FGGY-family carbohydrate kinase [Rubellimicrobium sp.]